MDMYEGSSFANLQDEDEAIHHRPYGRKEYGPADYLCGRISADAKVSVLSLGVTADGTRVYMVDDHGRSVVKASPPLFPNVIHDYVRKAYTAREALGEVLGAYIPTPFEEWDVDGVSCASFEELTPISESRLWRLFDLRKVKSPVLQWLRGIAAIDRGPSRQAEACLQALVECPFEELHEPAQKALFRLQSGLFSCRARVMHGDLTLGNVMLDPRADHDFMVIDWRGSNVQGFPIFDLIKFAETARLSRGVLRAELAAHAEMLGCELVDTRSYLLAAFGYIWLHLDQFPPERFIAMANSNLKTLDRALYVRMH